MPFSGTPSTSLETSLTESGALQVNWANQLGDLRDPPGSAFLSLGL